MFDDIPITIEHDRETLPPPPDWDVSGERHTLPIIYVDPQRHTRYHTQACLMTYLDTHDPLCPCQGKVDDIDQYLAAWDE